MGCDRKVPKYLADLKGARDGTGAPQLGSDGVYRTFEFNTNFTKVIAARGLTPKELKGFFKGIKIPMPASYKGVDGSKVPREQWFNPPRSAVEDKKN